MTLTTRGTLIERKEEPPLPSLQKILLTEAQQEDKGSHFRSFFAFYVSDRTVVGLRKSRQPEGRKWRYGGERRGASLRMKDYQGHAIKKKDY